MCPWLSFSINVCSIMVIKLVLTSAISDFCYFVLVFVLEVVAKTLLLL